MHNEIDRLCKVQLFVCIRIIYEHLIVTLTATETQTKTLLQLILVTHPHIQFTHGRKHQKVISCSSGSKSLVIVVPTDLKSLSIIEKTLSASVNP